MKWRLLSLCMLLLVPATLLAQADDNRAGLVIQFGDGRLIEVCVPLNGTSISGEELLRRAELPIVMQSSGMGAAVCQIDGEGCAYPQEPCFCQCQGPDCAYWSLQQQVDGEWRYLPQGASSITVRDGEVFGWSWGAGSVERGAVLPARSFPDICPVAAALSSAATEAATPSPVQPSPPLAPTTAPAPVAAAPASASVWNYLIFAIIVVVLGALLLRLRRRNRPYGE